MNVGINYKCWKKNNNINNLKTIHYGRMDVSEDTNVNICHY